MIWGPTDVPGSPTMRGVLHQYAFFISLFFAAALLTAAKTTEIRLMCAFYMFSLCGQFGVSAMYHRVNWNPRHMAMWRRLDHSMIFVLTAGTYTPLSTVMLEQELLYAIWAAALLGIVIKIWWLQAPEWVATLMYILCGWLGAGAFPTLLQNMGWLGVFLIYGGGVVYTAGGVIYALQRPNPIPTVFGYHEVFHALVIVGAAMHFAAVWIFVI
jgi:hemolysin III